MALHRESRWAAGDPAPTGAATAAPAAQSSGDVELAVFERGPSERLAVLWREYEGHHFVDLRVQFRAADGRWLPTKKGQTVKLREVFGVADALAKACALAETVRK